MFKNKATVYLLLLLTLVIWGMIIYKIIFATKESKGVAVGKFEKEIKHDIVSKKDLIYHHDYPNPFEKTAKMIIPRKTINPVNEKKKTAPEKPKKDETDYIKLNGVILSDEAKSAYFTINNKCLIGKVGDTLLNDFIISKIQIDSVLLKSKGTTKWITKNNSL